MKSKMQNYSRISAFLCFFMISCFSMAGIHASAQDLPEAPKQIVEKSIRNWNELFGMHVQATGWKYEGLISNEEQRQTAVAEIIDPQKAWMPAGNVSNPASVSAGRVSEDNTISTVELAEWQRTITSLIKTGQHKVRVGWKKGSTTFTTLCITNDQTIVYDNMFVNIATVNHHTKCLDHRLGWLWETSYETATRGKMWADLFVECDEEGNATCTNDCGGYMALGTADCKCVVIPKKNGCRLEYAWGFACGFKRVKFEMEADGLKFGVEIEGYLGSSGSGNGSCEEGCPVPKKAKPDSGVSAKPVSTPGGSAGASGPPKVATVSVKTLQGEVVDVNVPNNIRPGDQITGTMVNKSHSATLEGAVVDMEGRQTSLAEKFLKFAVPAGTAVIPFLIKGKDGTTLATGEIPVNHPDIPIPAGNVDLPLGEITNVPVQSPGSFAPFSYTQPGEPLTINGFFNGDGADTRCTLGGRPVEVVAESNRSCFVSIPEDMPGGQQILEIEEQGVTESLPVQVITTNLSANKTVVQRNTRAKVMVTVNNLENVDLDNNNFKIDLTNNSPGVIRFRNTDANSVTWNLTSANVVNGTFTATADIVGTAVGSYAVSAELSSSTCTECWDQYEQCIARVHAREEECYKECDQRNASRWCYLACSAAARIQEAECWAQYIGCMKNKVMGE